MGFNLLYIYDFAYILTYSYNSLLDFKKYGKFSLEINILKFKVPYSNTIQFILRNAYRKRIDCQDKQRQSAEFSNFSINTNVKPTRSPTDIHGVKERLSVHTVIGMQQPIGNNQNIGEK